MVRPDILEHERKLNEQFGGASVKVVASNGKHRTPKPVKAGDALRAKLTAVVKQETNLALDCTRCFSGTIAELNSAPLVETLLNQSPYELAVWENVQVSRDHGQKWAKLFFEKHPRPSDTIYRAVVSEACDLASFGTNVKRDLRFAKPALFVWLYYLGGSQSKPKGEELRYSMRSVRENYNGDASFLVVGDKPKWYTGPFIKVPRTDIGERTKYRNTLDCFRLLCDRDDLPESFVWMMDDTYFTNVVTLDDLSTPRYFGSVDADDPTHQGFHASVKRETFSVLRSGGRAVADFATHLPHVIDRLKFLEIWDAYDLDRRELLWEPLYWSRFAKHPRRAEPMFFHWIKQSREFLASLAHVTNNTEAAWDVDLHIALRGKFREPTEFESHLVPIPGGSIELVDSESTSVQRRIAKLGLPNYEPQTVATLLALWSRLPDGFTFFDVGASCGLFALMCAKLFPHSKIVGFEPTPATFATAKHLANVNGADIQYEMIALSDCTATLPLYLSETSEASNSLRKGFRESVGSIVVPSQTLDYFCERTALIPDVLKIDVETFEPEVLRGGKRTIAANRPFIIAEMRPNQPPDKLLAEMPEDYYATSMHDDEPRENWLLSPVPLDAEFWQDVENWKEAVAQV